MEIGKKDEFGNQFVKVYRCNNQDEHWSEVINVKHIAFIEENRVGFSSWGQNPGRRRGYNVYFSSTKNYVWINDKEYAEITKLLGV